MNIERLGTLALWKNLSGKTGAEQKFVILNIQ